MVIKKYNGGQKNKHKKCSICHQELATGEYYLCESGGKHECRCSYCGTKKLKTVIEEMQQLLNELQKSPKNALEGNYGKNGTSMNEVSKKSKMNIPQFIAMTKDEKRSEKLKYTQDIPILKKVPDEISLQILLKSKSYIIKYVDKEIINMFFEEIIKRLEMRRTEAKEQGAVFTCTAYNEFITNMKKEYKAFKN